MVADLAHDVRTDDVPEAELLARVAIMRMAEPGDQVMSRLIARYGAVAAADQARRGVLAAEFVSEEINRARAAGRPPALDRLAASWAARYADPVRDLAEGREQGARLVVPGDPEWPTQLDDLGDRRPYGLWLHGTVNLRFACLRSVAVVGARAATAYGVQVASELASGLGDRRWTVISGGAYGIDAAAHRGALASGMPTVVVLACGTDVCYPTAHQDLFQVVRSQGVVVSEVPMGSRPTRPRFLVRNRLIAALSRGTVVVQAAVRSGALNTATHANELNRHLMAVPGPITVEVSEGCHDLIRQGRAVCVTSVQEITELVGAIGGDLALVRRGPAHPRDALNDETRRVLEAVPTRVGTGPAAIAVSAGVDLSTALSCLGALAVAGFVEHGDRGWRLRHEPDG
ncbi:DNA-processing protein DprA [Microtetraspora malaysiensis]|uniref:DNA-processing protein DprA n=1 Tax=Microtetraspora malaysiensis TaxID=161358 RepID=A0ABW6SS26_9ACTN